MTKRIEVDGDAWDIGRDSDGEWAATAARDGRLWAYVSTTGRVVCPLTPPVPVIRALLAAHDEATEPTEAKEEPCVHATETTSSASIAAETSGTMGVSGTQKPDNSLNSTAAYAGLAKDAASASASGKGEPTEAPRTESRSDAELCDCSGRFVCSVHSGGKGDPWDS